MNSRHLLAWNLRKIRVSKQLSQEALASASKVDRVRLTKIERATENPTLELVERLAAALSVPIGTFFRTPLSSEPPPAVLTPGPKRVRARRILSEAK